MRRYFASLVVLLLIVMASCDRQSTLTYRIKNNVSDTIMVVRSRTDAPQLTDTFRISYNEEVTVGVNREGSEHVSTYKEKDVKLRKFIRMEVYNYLGEQSTTDFLRTDQWVYKENGSHMANYTATVSRDDF